MIEWAISQKKEQAKEYLRQMTQFKNKNNKSEDVVYAVSKIWINKWKQFVDYKFFKRKYLPKRGDPVYSPQEIDLALFDINELLINSTNFLDKRNNRLIKFIPPKLMNYFQKRYNIKSVCLFKPKKTVIPFGMYPIEIKCIITPISQLFKTELVKNNSNQFRLYFYQSIKNVTSLIKEKDWQYRNCKLTFWYYKKLLENDKGYETIFLSPEILIGNLKDNNYLIVCEYQLNEDFEKNKTIEELAAGKKGKVGLNNLGNTCYMDSGLQCLSNCDHLTEYFLKYFNESKINRTMQDGTNGKLANAYQTLLKNLWKTNNYSSYSPIDFKREIGNYNELFYGTHQQDSFELISFTLNALHEDINLVLTPQTFTVPTPSPEAVDDELVKFKWARYDNKKQSIIISLFYGMYKSILYCPLGCIIRVFETFHAFQLPLNVYFLTCVFIYYNLSIKPIEIKIPFESDKKFGHLRKEISEIFDIKEDSFVFADVEDGKIIRLNNAERHVKRESTIYCFQIDPEITQETKTIPSIINKSQEEIERVMKKVFTCVEYQERKVISFTKKDQSDKIRVEPDNKYNLDDKYIPFIVNIPVSDSKDKIIQRLLFIDSTLTLEELNNKLDSYLSTLQYSDLENPVNNNMSYISADTNAQSNLAQSDCQDLMPNDSQSFNSHSHKKIDSKPFVPFIYRLIFNGLCPCSNKNCQGCYFIENNRLTPLCHLFKTLTHMAINAYLYIDKEEREYANMKEFEAYEINLQPKKALEKKTFQPERILLPNEEDAYNLEYCIKEFQTIQKLNGQWRCSNCKNLGNATKGMYVYSCSQYLIIQLKRFKDNMSNKYSQLIRCPINDFDMSPYIVEKEKNMTYDLIGVINHYGSFYGGHYTAYAKNCIDNKWSEFDDSHVSSINESDVVTKEAYVLWYKKRNLDKVFDKEKHFNKTFV